MTCTLSPGRYRLLLTIGGQPCATGWWDSETTARRKMTSWIGDWGQPGTTISLTDEETGTQLDAWPDEGTATSPATSG
ncbi:hypothetical protein [Streptomyces misionensis]|uniref:hypothetical protein n=1 Tax=Streptomyces misionensis TaxID=67331 RepID=UPI003BB1C3CD